MQMLTSYIDILFRFVFGGDRTLLHAPAGLKVASIYYLGTCWYSAWRLDALKSGPTIEVKIGGQ